ncbi:Aminopeptidase N [archaeon HR01]|nr:Aminopeptidase N [archaeon HR01]
MQHYIKLGKNFTFPEYVPRYPREPKFRISHYRLELRLDPVSRSISGEAQLELNASDGVVELDAVDLEIHDVSGPGDISYRYDGRVIIIRTLKDTTHTIRIRYSAKPRAGLYFILPDKHYPGRVPVIYSQGEPEYHRHWMPIYDYPNMKFTTELLARAPKEYTVVSNGDLVDVRDDGVERVWHYRMSKPHSPYLISLVAGIFEREEEEVDGIRLVYYVPKGMKSLIPNSFSKTSDIIRFFTQLTGTPYPFKTYTQVCVPEFIVGGMENTTAATLTELTLHDDIAHRDFSSDPLIAHELAHQWFGDLVTCRDWSHIWLNESFATYLENLYLRKDRGEEEFIYELLNDLQSYLEEYRKRYSRPVVMRVYRYPEELFDRHAYPKGGLILHMLSHYLGDEPFWRGVNLFLKRFAFGTADTEDLRKCLEEASGRPLEMFFEQFVYSAGHPTLNISYRWSEKDGLLSISVKQEQGEDSPESYGLPLELVVNTGQGSIKVSVPLERRESLLYLNLSEAPWHICIDPYVKLLKDFKAERPVEELVKALRMCSHTACRLEAARALGRMGGLKAIKALEDAVIGDGFWGVAATAAQSLGSIGGDEARDALLRCLTRVSHPKVRRAIVEGLKNFRGDEVVADTLAKILQDGGESYYVRSQAATSLGLIKGLKYEDVLRANLSTPSHSDVIAAGCIQGLAELGSEECFKTILEYTSLGKPNTLRIAATVALAKFPDRREVYEKLAELSRDPYDRVRQAVISACRELLDHRLLPILDEMAERDVNERVRRGSREVAKKIREHLEKGVEYKALREEIERVRDENRRLVERISKLEGKEV